MPCVSLPACHYILAVYLACQCLHCAAPTVACKVHKFPCFCQLSDPEVYGVCVQAFPQRSRFHRQELSNILWALATLQHELPENILRDVSDEFARLALAQLGSAEPGRERHLANMAWACARLRVNPLGGGLLNAACAELVANPGSFSVQNMANIVLAAGILQHPFPQAAVDLVRPFLLFKFLCHMSSAARS